MVKASIQSVIYLPIYKDMFMFGNTTFSTNLLSILIESQTASHGMYYAFKYENLKTLHWYSSVIKFGMNHTI